MPIIIKRPLVFEDIADIWDYIAEDNENNADAFIDYMPSGRVVDATCLMTCNCLLYFK